MDTKRKISAVIFDMDGLMFDTERISIITWQQAGKEFGIDIKLEVILEIIGLNSKSSEKVFRKHFGKEFPLEEIRKSKDRYAWKYIREKGLPVKPGLYELLDYLDQKGSVKKAVATSTNRAAAMECLTLAGVENRFDGIICGDEIVNGKPEPDIFLKAARRLGRDPNECMVLEDSQNGLIAASKAGMLPVLIPDIKRPSDEVLKLIYKELKTLDEVIGLIEALERSFCKGHIH